jgi:AcrR family transcriptional regulator
VSEARGLSRERIVRAAVAMIERDGVDAVSMRRLAGELGVGTMSLYNHVPNKAALLDAIAEFILGDMEFAADPRRDWRDQTRGLCRGFREIARRYPRSVLVVITRQPRSAVGLRPVEVALAAVRKAGFEGEVAVRLVRTFVSFVLGSLVNEVGVAEAGGLDVPDLDAHAAALEQAGYHHVRELLPVLTRHDHERDFEFGMELLISAMEALARDHGEQPRS